MEIFLIGLLAGLVWIWLHKASKRDESLHRAGKSAKQCPHCLEYVKAGATVCRYCQRDIPADAKPAPKVQYGPGFLQPKSPRTPPKPVPDLFKRQVFWTITIFAVLAGLALLGNVIGHQGAGKSTTTPSADGSSGRNRGYQSDSAAIEACVRRGRAYFSEIGSFPTLSDGRDALTVARERCRRTTTAF